MRQKQDASRFPRGVSEIAELVFTFPIRWSPGERFEKKALIGSQWSRSSSSRRVHLGQWDFAPVNLKTTFMTLPSSAQLTPHWFWTPLVEKKIKINQRLLWRYRQPKPDQHLLEGRYTATFRSEEFSQMRRNEIISVFKINISICLMWCQRLDRLPLLLPFSPAWAFPFYSWYNIYPPSSLLSPSVRGSLMT